MAPKKDAKKGEEERNFFQENYFMEKKKEVLEYRLMMKDEQIRAAQAAEETLQKRIAELDRGFKDEHDKSLEVTGEMSRQYREMQDSFNERIEVLDAPFDPETAEAVGVVPVEEERHDRVVEELRPGYRLGEITLRPAQVQVGRRRD